MVEASIKYTPENMILDLRVWNVQQDPGVFGERIIAPLTSAMEVLQSKPLVPAFAEADFGEDKTVRVKDKDPQAKDAPVPYGTPGYSPPVCVQCPNPNFPEAALRAGAQGTVVLSVVIGADGTAERIAVQRALPCGWDQQAIEVVKNWKFKPAMDPEGKPVAIVQPVELTFHMH